MPKSNLYGFLTLDPNDSRILDNGWVAGIHYPTLEQARKLGIIKDSGNSCFPSALEEYEKKYGKIKDPELRAQLLHKYREDV